MLVIPAIDLKNGKCVRLKQGDFAQKTEYAGSPVLMAQTFLEHGAKRLHVVDLDGAESGRSINEKIIESLRREVEIPIQLGGGLRSLEQMQRWLSLGVDALIVGTAGVKRPELLIEGLAEFGPERLILAVDAKDGKVMIDGWQKESAYTAEELARKFKAHGLERILYTDILRDGMFTGPNLPATSKLAQQTSLKVTASGGIGSLEDLENLRALQKFGVDSAVVGRAIYENRISLDKLFSC